MGVQLPVPVGSAEVAAERGTRGQQKTAAGKQADHAQGSSEHCLQAAAAAAAAPVGAASGKSTISRNARLKKAAGEAKQPTVDPTGAAGAAGAAAAAAAAVPAAATAVITRRSARTTAKVVEPHPAAAQPGANNPAVESSSSSRGNKAATAGEGKDFSSRGRQRLPSKRFSE